MPRRASSSTVSHDLLCRWEWFSSLDFDWLYISGKRTFRWPLVRSASTASDSDPKHLWPDILLLEPLLSTFCSHWNVRSVLDHRRSSLNAKSTSVNSAIALNVTSYAHSQPDLHQLTRTRRIIVLQRNRLSGTLHVQSGKHPSQYLLSHIMSTANHTYFGLVFDSALVMPLLGSHR
jgi:hypothetical protein